MRILYFILILFIGASCTPNSAEKSPNETVVNNATIDKATLEGQITTLQDFFKNNADKPINKTKGKEFVLATNKFAAAFPQDPATPNRLFMGAEVARSVGSYDEAIKMLDQVFTNYSNHEKAAPALFLKAFTYEENIKDKEAAKKYYNDFLATFPEHNLSKQVEQLLQVIDKTPEELIESFKKKNQ